MELCDKFEDRPKVVVAEFDATGAAATAIITTLAVTYNCCYSYN